MAKQLQKLELIWIGKGEEHYDDGIKHSLWLSLMRLRIGYFKKSVTE